MKKMLLLTLGTSVLSALVISNAYATKQQFYTTVVYLLNSNRTLGVSSLRREAEKFVGGAKGCGEKALTEHDAL